MTENIWKHLTSKVKSFFIIIGGFLLGLIVITKVSKIGEVKKFENWKPVPGHTDKVVVMKPDKDIIVQLPKDPKTNKQIKSNNVIAVGVSEEGGKVNVTIKKRPDDSDAFFDNKPDSME